MILVLTNTINFLKNDNPILSSDVSNQQLLQFHIRTSLYSATLIVEATLDHPARLHW